MVTLRRSLVWRALDEPGLEYFTLIERRDGWKLEGTIIRRLKGVPLSASYQIFCDDKWRTRDVKVSMKRKEARRSLQIRVDKHQTWWHRTRELSQLHGCYDVDLMITPSTNTLPIRRLVWKISEQRDIIVAWIRFPSLSIQPLLQRYTRLDARKYSYDINGVFSVDLEVDDLGLVRSYPAYWKLEGIVQ